MGTGCVGDDVCVGVGGGEKQPSSYGISLFLANTAARLLARVLRCTSLLVSTAVGLVVATGLAAAGLAALTAGPAATGLAAVTWPAAMGPAVVSRQAELRLMAR